MENLNPVTVMDEMIYSALGTYYNALEKTGYMSFGNMQKLLILIFYKDFVFNDYRGLLSREDYHLIERALDCLYGTTCLIPYPDYLKMGKLKLGEITEIGQRLKNLEDTSVLKLIHDLDSAEGDVQSDVLVMAEED
jgi:hypothetical protein